MIMGYPFWADNAAPTTPNIYDPILRRTITSLTFRGTSRVQKLMGISISSGTRTVGNSIRVKIGNSLPTYRRITVPANGHQNDLGADAQVVDINYTDLGGLPILEGDDIELSAQGLEGAAGTGTFSGVLWIEDLEPASERIPSGNIVCLVHGALAAGGDAGVTLTDLSAVLDARTLENTRLYTPYMTIVEPEDQAVEACLFYVGKNVMTCPVGKMVYPRAPIQFSGLEYNSGAFAWFGQCLAAAGIIVYMYCMESEIPGAEKSTNVTPINPITSSMIPGVINTTDIVQASGASLGGKGTILKSATAGKGFSLIRR